jgi:hypothetical protein
MDVSLRRRVERMGITLSQVVKEAKKKKVRLPGEASMLIMFGLVSLMGHSPSAFTACDCTNRRNIVELDSLLEPDVCAATGSHGEI